MTRRALFTLPLALLAVIAFVGLSLQGCDQDATTTETANQLVAHSSNEAEPPTLQDSIGYYHNVYLDETLTSLDKITDEPLTVNLVQDIALESAIGDNFISEEDRLALKEQFREVNEMFLTTGIYQRNAEGKYTWRSDFEGDFVPLIDYMGNNDLIDSALHSDVVAVLERQSELSPSDLVAYAKTRLSNKSYAGNDDLSAAVFLQTLEASYEYWNKYYEEEYEVQPLKDCAYTDFLADAAAGIAGAAFGGVTGILTGAAGSAVAHCVCSGGCKSSGR